MTDEAALCRMEDLAEHIACPNISTNDRKNIYEEMTTLYQGFACIRDLWDWVVDAARYAARFVKKIGFMLVNEFHPDINWNGIKAYRVEKGKHVEQFYLIRLLDKDGELIYSKCGTTTVSTVTRMKQHLKYYYDYGVRSIEVLRLWNCNDIPAEGLESKFRSMYIRRYPNSFKKNDRFTNIEFDLKEADYIVEEYLNKGE